MLTLLADVREGLKKLKEIGCFGIPDIDKNPSLPKQVNQVTDPPNPSISALQTTQSDTYDNGLQPLGPIKIETENQGEYMTEEAFESLSSPKKGKKRVGETGTPKTMATAKRVKVMNPPDDYMLMAEMKRKAIRDCNATLKVSHPTNDPHKVIYNSVKRLNRGLIYGPM